MRKIRRMRQFRFVVFSLLFCAGCSTTPHYDVSHCPDNCLGQARQEPPDITPQRLSAWVNSVLP